MKIIIFRDTQNFWRAKVVSSNGKTLMVSSEAYKRKLGLMNMISAVRLQFPGAEVIEDK